MGTRIRFGDYVAFDWTEAAVERLKALHARGLTGSQIAAEIGGGVTRNAVIGKVHRLGLHRAPKAPKRQNEARSQAQPVAVEKVRAARAKAVAPRVVKVAAAPEPPVTPTIAGWPKPRTATAIHFMSEALRSRHCRMPLWDDATPVSERLYCGAEVIPGKSWCPACANLVYAPPQERRAA